MWVQGRLNGCVKDDGSIEITLSECKLIDGPKPKSIEESGADAGVFYRLGQRIPGKIDTLAFIGGAVAILVPFYSLALLPKHHMDRLLAKYGPWDFTVFIALVRNTGAPVLWNVAEPCGGMAEKLELTLHTLEEGCELGVFRGDGWLRFVLPSDLRKYQEDFNKEQEFWWKVVRPGFPQVYGAPIHFINIGRDKLDGNSCILASGPVGDFTIVRVAKLNLLGTGWLFLDTESRPGNKAVAEPEWVPLRRKVVAIARRPGKAPIMFEIAPEGHLHPGGIHTILEGENFEQHLSHLGKAVLKALGWLEEGEE